MIEDHHRRVGAISIDSAALLDVKVLIDRARNVFLYAWYCYELLVVSEMQAFGALELALKLRLLGPSEVISGSSKRGKTDCCHPKWMEVMSWISCLRCAMRLLTAQ